MALNLSMCLELRWTSIYRVQKQRDYGFIKATKCIFISDMPWHFGLKASLPSMFVMDTKQIHAVKFNHFFFFWGITFILLRYINVYVLVSVLCRVFLFVSVLHMHPSSIHCENKHDVKSWMGLYHAYNLVKLSRLSLYGFVCLTLYLLA